MIRCQRPERPHAQCAHPRRRHPQRRHHRPRRTVGNAVRDNSEGSVPARAIQFEENTLKWISESKRLSPGAVAALHLAWTNPEVAVRPVTQRRSGEAVIGTPPNPITEHG
jgi:hypothetical protein